MASGLDTKINSYTLEKGLEFSAAVTTTPPQTGSITAKTLSLSNTAAIAYQSTVNPLFGSGSWQLTMTGTEAAPVSAPRVTYNTLEQYDVFRDGDWSLGFWWKLNTQMISTRSSNVWAISPSASATQPGVLIQYNGTNAINNAGKLSINYGGNNNVPISGVISLNTWYYIAVRRQNINSATNFNVYINGINTLASTWAVLTGTTSVSVARWGDTNAYANYSWSISNSYYTTSAIIGASQIAEIYAAGVGTVGRTVKYYNGTAWVDSSAQKVYNGTAWVDWNAKRFDGTTWVTI